MSGQPLFTAKADEAKEKPRPVKFQLGDREIIITSGGRKRGDRYNRKREREARGTEKEI